MAGKDLATWLAELERRHPRSIELGLERVGAVGERLGIDLSDRTVVNVGGTNGKGSVVAFAEACCRAAGWDTFTYTSPHLRAFTERIRLNGMEAEPAAIVAALDRVEAARGDISLTYFEHTTLAGLLIAGDSNSEVILLEVGLGGRLDAVNIVDPDVAVITQIGLDHAEWLGETRGEVALEKAGIARPGRPVVVGDRNPPVELGARLGEIGARVIQAGRDFDWRPDASGWRLVTAGGSRRFPRPRLDGACQFGNAACALMAVACFDRIPDDAALARGLETAMLPGRFQRVRRNPDIILDVAHNPDAAAALAASLDAEPARTLAVCAVLADKDAAGIAAALAGQIDHWYCAGLAGERGRTGAALAERVRAGAVPGQVEALESVADALAAARRDAGADDRIIVFGSFYTVADALDTLDRED